MSAATAAPRHPRPRPTNLQCTYHACFLLFAQKTQTGLETCRHDATARRCHVQRPRPDWLRKPATRSLPTTPAHSGFPHRPTDPLASFSDVHSDTLVPIPPYDRHTSTAQTFKQHGRIVCCHAYLPALNLAPPSPATAACPAMEEGASGQMRALPAVTNRKPSPASYKHRFRPGALTRALQGSVR